MINNSVLDSGVQQSGSVRHIDASILFTLWDLGCYTVLSRVPIAPYNRPLWLTSCLRERKHLMMLLVFNGTLLYSLTHAKYLHFPTHTVRPWDNPYAFHCSFWNVIPFLVLANPSKAGPFAHLLYRQLLTLQMEPSLF